MGNFITLLLFSLFFLAACTTVNIRDYAGSSPVFRLEEYFAGKSTGWGVVLDRSGGVVKQFRVDLDGSVEGNTLTLFEKFFYSDGSSDERTWTVNKTGENNYEGFAADVIGKAVGISSGNALNWSYTLLLPARGTEFSIRFDDWMFLQDEETLINKAIMSKFGFQVGEVLIFFKKDKK
ncbi:MAG TPA: DUF3833 domain-containing protein [Oligoflexia bacterium]|nr:DUF3833 domain-containing protein [Oligoflexia bacterium]HMP49227.1 DUF3833 domain-containing protein [Oligoflexia bacterium]